MSNRLTEEERREHYRAMRELLGRGYIDSYYKQMAGDFIEVTEWVLDRREQEAALKAEAEKPNRERLVEQLHLATQRVREADAIRLAAEEALDDYDRQKRDANAG